MHEEIISRAFAKYNPREVFYLEQAAGNQFEVALSFSAGSVEWSKDGTTGRFGDGADVDFKNSTHKLFVLYGIGDGEYAKKLLQNNAVKELLIFEPSLSQLKTLLKLKDLSSLTSNARVRFIVGSDHQSYIRRLEAYFYEYINRYMYAANPQNLIALGVEKIPGFKDYCVKFSQAFAAAVNNVAAQSGFGQEDSFFGIHNAIGNLRVLQNTPNVDLLKDKFKDLPAVVIAPGPSLKYSIPYLKKIQNKAVLIACDTATGILWQNGIEPHFACSLERVIESKLIFETDRVPQTVLTVPSIIYPETLVSYPGKKMHVCRDFGVDSWFFSQHARHYLGQTVSQMALKIAQIINAPTVYLVGVDCAYDPDSGKSHHSQAHEYVQESSQIVKDENSGYTELDITGDDGKPKRTWTIWLMNSFVIADMVASHTQKVYRVGPIEYGIPIPNTERQDSAILEKITGTNSDEIFSRIEKILCVTAKSTDLSGLKQKTVASLEKYIRFSSDKLSELTQSFFHYNPRMQNNFKHYEDYYARLEQELYDFVSAGDLVYLGVLHSIMQGVYAKVGFNINRLNREPLTIASSLGKFDEFNGWYSQLLLWSTRVKLLIEKELT